MASLNGIHGLRQAGAIGALALIVAACSSGPSTSNPANVAGGSTGTNGNPNTGAGTGGLGSSTGGGLTGPVTTPPANPGHVVVRRLTSFEYNRTVRDLLGTSLTPGDAFPADDLGAEFDDVGSALTLSPNYVRAYEQAAYALVDDLLASTDAVRKQRILSCDAATGGEACAQTILSAFARKAWRRPISTEEATGLMVPYRKASELKLKPVDGLRYGLAGVLVSPFFVFKLELDPDIAATTPRRLNGHELATRLSYALWSTMPDEQLFAAADADALATDEAVDAQVTRMLADTRAEALADAFAGQWLNFRGLKDHEVDPTAFKSYSPALVTAMQAEARRYFGEFVKSEDLPVQQLLTGRFSFLDASLAKFYGVAAPAAGGDLVRVDTMGVERSGMLTMGAFLMASSLPSRTSVVRRGQYVYERLMCGEIPAPPPGIAAFPEAQPGLTARELSAQHRASPSCAGCHNIMDPLGFGLETYDGIGSYRTTDSGATIDSSGTLPSGATFRGGVELANALATDPAFVGCLTSKLATFGVGRLMNQASDPQWISYLSTQAGKSKATSLPSLLRTIIKSELFRSRSAM